MPMAGLGQEGSSTQASKADRQLLPAALSGIGASGSGLISSGQRPLSLSRSMSVGAQNAVSFAAQANSAQICPATSCLCACQKGTDVCT